MPPSIHTEQGQFLNFYAHELVKIVDVQNLARAAMYGYFGELAIRTAQQIVLAFWARTIKESRG